MRIVLDTNALVSALLFRGEASRLVEGWRTGRFRLLVSRGILDEYVRVLAYPKFRLDEREISALMEEFVLPFCDVVEASAGEPFCRDPADDAFLFCAAAGAADAVVTGDKDLLDAGPGYQGIPILTIRGILDRLSDG